MNNLIRTLSFASFFSVILLACNRIPSEPATTPEPRATLIVNDSPSYPYPDPIARDPSQPEPADGETILLPIISGPPASLPSQGPWLLVLADEKLSILSLEGDTVLPVSALTVAGPPTLETTVSPTGRHLAFITTTDPRLHNLTLRIVSLPDVKTIHTVALTSSDTEPTVDAAPGEPNFEIARTIASLDNLAWSPDGTQLAFIGAQSGSSADLYRFEVATGQLTRLTHGPSQATRPVWSPDGGSIVYSEISSLGTGAGFGMTGVWARPLDGTEPQSLDMPENSGDERHLGWAGPATAIRYTFNALCGTNNLRAVNLQTGQVRVFWAGAFQAIGFDPESAKVLISVADLDPTCNPSGMQGLILTHPEAQDALRASDKNALEIAWSPEAGRFLAATSEGVLAIDLFGRRTLLPGAFDRLPKFDPFGERYVWTQTDFQGIPGIWLGEMETVPTQIYNGKAALPLWDPTNAELIFFDNKGVYKTDLTGQPQLIAEGFGATDAVMIQPR